MHLFNFFRTADQTPPHRGIHVENLEDRTLMSAGPSSAAAHIKPEHAGGYEFDLTPASSTSNISAQSHVVAPPSLGVTSIKVTDDIVVGKFVLPMPASHPTDATESHSGTAALSSTMAHSFAGRPPKSWGSWSTTHGRRVLVIEDDPSSRNALVAILRHRGWDVTTASTLADGMQELASDPDRVVVDLMLPDGEGEAIIRQVQDSHLHSRVTVMTGVGDPTRLARVREMHPDAILSKPINVAQLLRGLNAGRPN